MRLINADKGLISKIQRATGCNFVTANEIVEGMSTVNAIPIPDDATNGDMIKAMFPNALISKDIDCYVVEIEYDNGDSSFKITYPRDWWNAPYERGE